MRIALAQINSTTVVTDNLAKVRAFSKDAAEQGAEIVVFPEATMIAFGSDLPTGADEYSAVWKNALRELATELGLTIVVGEFQRASENKVINQLSAYTPDGNCAQYAKIHLYDAFGYHESDSVVAGDEIALINHKAVVLGLATCYDIRFPKLFAELSRGGAALAIVSASWGAGPGKLEQWNTLARARALDSNMYIVAVDQADPAFTGVMVPDSAPTGVGGSLVTDPFGHVLAELGQGEELRIVDIEPALSQQAADTIPVLTNAKLGY